MASGNSTLFTRYSRINPSFPRRALLACPLAIKPFMLFTNLLWGWLFIVFLFFSACAEEDKEKEILYDFPSLSLGQLVDLKKESESMEGFFITTDLSDWDPSYADRGFYLYVCVRFLNDLTLNEKLKKSALPLLIQASNHKDRPEAETLLLLHPQTKKSDGKYQFYMEESQHFALSATPILVKEQEYFILDSDFNSSGRLTSLSFLKKDTDLKSLDRPVQKAKEENDEESDSKEEPVETKNNEDDKAKDLVLKVGAFAKQFTGSCASWPILNYTHSEEVAEYLKVSYSEEKKTQTSSSSNTSGGDQSSVSASDIPPQTLIPETAPYEPVQKS